MKRLMRAVQPNFVEYFKKEWLGVHCNWFEGAAEYTPSTNNALESHNAVIKRKVTLRKRLPFNQFLLAVMQMTADISQEFTKNNRILATEPEIKADLIAQAALMEKNGFTAFRVKSTEADSIKSYVIPSQNCSLENATEKHYKELVRAKWKTFDEFISHGYQKFWLTHICTKEWKINSKCTCPSFFKEHICKHIIAVGLREKIVDCPNTSIPTLLAATRKKAGRPKLAKQALIVQ